MAGIRIKMQDIRINWSPWVPSAVEKTMAPTAAMLLWAMVYTV
jgi:hypothetical protein